MPSQWNSSQSACGWHCCFAWPCAHDTWCDWSSQNCVAGQHQTWAMYVLFFENQEVMLESQNHTLPLYLGRPDRPVCTPCRSWKPLFFCCRAQSPTQQRGFFWKDSNVTKHLEISWSRHFTQRIDLLKHPRRGFSSINNIRHYWSLPLLIVLSFPHIQMNVALTGLTCRSCWWKKSWTT